jgi:tripartite-type tricarboxylate transporter receptor subunit TctC
LAACGAKTGTTSSKEAASTASAQTAKAETKEKYPTRPISIIVSYAAGGGSDLGVRALAPFLEKELGVPITVVNKPGAGGWMGWLDLLGAKNDGYTIALINTPNLMTGYMDPSQKRKENIDNFELIANQVTDAGAIAIRADEKRFTNMKELVEYAKKNEVTTTSTGVAGDDHIAALKMNKKFGTKFNAIHNKGVAESITAVLGGHVDVMFANVGEVTTLYNNKEIKVLGVMNDNRAKSLPDVPTLKESGYDGVVSWSARGFAAAKGMDEEKLKVLRAAFEKVIKNPDHIKKMADMGLEVDYQNKDGYAKALKLEEKSILEIKDLLGW